ncbi:MAG: CapA family protein [Pseudomonadales bacterium]|nr:CapA family protein [Pseudomonadales bacterium]
MFGKSVLMLWAVLFASQVWAHGGAGCNPLENQVLDERPPYYMHETPTFRAFGKRFSTSEQLKRYFAQQKKILSMLADQEPPADAISQLKLASVGDIMRMPSKQDGFVDDVLKEYLDGVDILNGNLETLISDKYPVPPESLFNMNSDPSLLTAFRNKAGQNYFSVLSTVNNHTYDFPDDAIADTLAHLRSEGIYQSGIRLHKSEKSYLVFEHKGIRIGYYAVTTFVNKQEMLKKTKVAINPMVEGIEPIPFNAWKSSCDIDIGDIKNVLKQMKQDGADIKIISIHWGIEHDMYPQPVQVELAHQMVAAGADIIVGAHPHVPQPSEVCFINGYENNLPQSEAEAQRSNGCVLATMDGKPRKAMIYYSLGNFTSYTPFFWQQVGVIAEMNIVQLQKNEQRIVDWYTPKYVFTYDHAENPPNGQRHLNLLNTYIARRCDGNGCSKATKNLVGMLDRHIYGESLSWWEEIRYTAITTYQAVKDYVYWTYLAPQSY